MQYEEPGKKVNDFLTDSYSILFQELRAIKWVYKRISYLRVIQEKGFFMPFSKINIIRKQHRIMTPKPGLTWLDLHISLQIKI